jgi:hypothetical protein
MPAPSQSNDRLKLTITAATGLLKGSFVATPPAPAATAITGALDQKNNVGVKTLEIPFRQSKGASKICLP